MATENIVGYLTGPYQAGPYMVGTIADSQGFQVDMQLKSDLPQGMQTEMSLEGTDDDPHYGFQVDMISKIEQKTGMQFLMALDSPDDDHYEGMQVDLQTKNQTPLGMEIKIYPLQHWLHAKYMTESEGYLTEGYLGYKMCAFQGMQVKMKLTGEADDHRQGFQVDQKIEDNQATGMQVDAKVEAEKNIGFQTNMIKTNKTGMQVNFVIYNTEQLRLLCSFPSRGTGGTYPTLGAAEHANWYSPNTLATGDLGKLANLNTDVLEQRIQSANGEQSLFQLWCDTGAGNTFVDTIGILEHNFTRSALVTVQASDVSDFSSIKFSYTMETELENMYYVAPTLPTEAARYYRFFIQDGTNPDNNIKVGTIIFGTSDIFTPRETFQNPASYGLQHFKDTVNTEGFTNVSNDRAMRKILGLTFQKLLFDGGNYKLLQDYFKFSKTDLKCLIIPRPTRPSSLAVFSKLVSLPNESHTAIDDDNHHVDLELNWDESL